MSGPERIWLWKGDDLASELAVNPPKIATTEYTKYIRADLADPAAIREAALREAEKALRDWQDALNANRFPETAITVGVAADAILALIPKGAADDRALIDKGAG